jgi:hypothetical protein
VQASIQAAFLAESIVFSAASVDEPVMATAKAAADNNMVMERNMVFPFRIEKPVQSFRLTSMPTREESLVASTRSDKHEQNFRVTQFRQMP